MHHQPIANDPPDNEASNQTNTKDSAVSNEINTMSERIMIKLEELKHQELFDRIQLPKIRKDRKAKELIHKGNIAIGKLKAEMVEPLGITEINQLIYATASVITEELGVTIQKMKGQNYNNLNGKKGLAKISSA